MALVDGLDLAAVYYRADHLKEVGIDGNHLPKTLEELVDLGKKLDKFDSSHHLTRVGYLPKGFTGYVAAFKGKFNENGHIVIDTPENLRAMKFLEENNKRLGFDEVTRFTSSLAADAGPTIPLIEGNFSIMFDGEWRVKQVAQYAPDLPYYLAPLPPPKDGNANACMSSPNYLMIPTAAKDPQGAWEFAKFCVGFLHPEDGGRNMGDMGWLPDDPEIAAAKSYQAYLKKYPPYRVFVDLMTSPNLEIPPRGPMQGYVMDQFSKAEDGVLRGSQTSEDALKTVQSNYVAELARLKRLGDVR
jgi:multiple sugar transport system substrate-binding protein